MKNIKWILSLLLLQLFSCKSVDVSKKNDATDLITKNESAKGTEFSIFLKNGKYHNHPTFAIWLETLDGEFIQTLFVTKYISEGIFAYSSENDSIWKNEPGEVERPAALPYWLHKRGNGELKLPSPDNSVPDAYSGATPQNNAVLQVKSNQKLNFKFRLLMEVNQTWDWNEFWTNNKYPGNFGYKTSSQPSLVYAVTIDPENPMEEYYLNPTGHGHYAGQTGLLYTNLKTITTAKQIFEEIKVVVNK